MLNYWAVLILFLFLICSCFLFFFLFLKITLMGFMFLVTSAFLGYVSWDFVKMSVMEMFFLSFLVWGLCLCFRFIHLAWIRLRRDGFILRTDCFYFYIRLILVLSGIVVNMLFLMCVTWLFLTWF
jgi:hypothetical protein